VYSSCACTLQFGTRRPARHGAATERDAHVGRGPVALRCTPGICAGHFVCEMTCSQPSTISASGVEDGTGRGVVGSEMCSAWGRPRERAISDSRPRRLTRTVNARAMVTRMRGHVRAALLEVSHVRACASCERSCGSRARNRRGGCLSAGPQRPMQAHSQNESSDSRRRAAADARDAAALSIIHRRCYRCQCHCTR